MQKAVIYARFSSSSQTEQSIEGQLRVCKDYAKRNNLLIIDEYIDRAKTGTNDMRPSFQKMMKDCVKKEWEYVLVYKLDRFSRDKYDSAVHKHTLKQNGIKVISATENIPDSPEAIIYESILEGFAQYYSAELSQKVHRGLNESYLKGNWTGGNQLYGYKAVDMKNVVVEEEAFIIREIYKLFTCGKTGPEIVDFLNKTSLRYRNGKKFTVKQVYKILINPKYNGKTFHNGILYDKIYPAIIDDKTWELAQKIHKTNSVKHVENKTKYQFVLSGKIFCGHCHSKLIGGNSTSKSKKKHSYYACRSRIKEHATCPNKSIRKDELEKIVFDTTYKLLKSENTLLKIAEALVEYHKKMTINNQLIKDLESKKQTAKQASKNIIAAMEAGIITEQTKERLQELESEIAQCNYDIEREKLKCYSHLNINDIMEFFHDVIVDDYKSDFNVRRVIVSTFINKIVVNDTDIEIYYNFMDPKLKNQENFTDFEVMEVPIDSAFSFNHNCASNEANFPPQVRDYHTYKVIVELGFFIATFDDLQIAPHKNTEKKSTKSKPR